MAAQAPAGDRGDLLASGLPDVPSWWGEPGRPGFAPDLAAGVGYPWVLAGHVVGAWSLEDRMRPALGPFPGIATVETPLGWMDSLAIAAGSEAGWRGFRSALAQGRVWRDLPAGGRRRNPAVGDLVLFSGSGALDGNALAVTRGDSAASLSVGAASWNRGGLGALAPAGRHHYVVAGEWTRGRHRLEGALAQAGSAAALFGGESQAATGAGGDLRYLFEVGGPVVAVALGRGYAHHESFGGALFYSRRDAHERHASVAVEDSSRAWGARAEVSDAWVTRTTEVIGQTPWKATSVWVGARAERSKGPARITGSLGLGRHDAVGATEIAPSLKFQFSEGSLVGAAEIGRVLVPVWSDLAAGESPFLQSTWKGDFSLRWRGARGNGAGVSWTAGRTRDRALLTRWPLEELWLRDGFRRDPGAYDFALATVESDLRWRSWLAHGEAYWLFRDGAAPQAFVDPRRGGRAAVETRFRAFLGDLGVRLRGDVGVMGGRASEAPVPRWIEGDATLGASAALTLADAEISLGFRNLENKRRVLSWIDPLTGEEALSEGMEFRLSLTWRLYN